MFSIIQRKHLFFISIIIEIISINMNIAWRNVLTGSSVTLYMTPYCECCVKYKDYLSSLRAKVEVATVEDVDKLMEKLEVPSKTMVLSSSYYRWVYNCWTRARRSDQKTSR